MSVNTILRTVSSKWICLLAERPHSKAFSERPYFQLTTFKPTNEVCITFHDMEEKKHDMTRNVVDSFLYNAGLI